MNNLENSPSYQRHLQWLDKYNEVREKCRTENPKLFPGISPKVFYQEVADHFCISYQTAYQAILSLTKKKS